MKKWSYYDFFNRYRIIPVKNDEDLLYQVGWSKSNKPLESTIISKVVTVIKSKLELSEKDILIDLCCGNGIFTYELSKFVKQVIGIDFSKIYIENAIKFKTNSNIFYIHDNIENIERIIRNKIIDKNEVKILMSYSLGYFTIETFTNLLIKLNQHFNKFHFYITGIPDYSKYKIAFPSKAEQFKFILYDRILGKTKGIGRFWKVKELIKISLKLKLQFAFDEEMNWLPNQNYRINLLLKKS